MVRVDELQSEVVRLDQFPLRRDFLVKMFAQSLALQNEQMASHLPPSPPRH